LKSPEFLGVSLPEAQLQGYNAERILPIPNSVETFQFAVRSADKPPFAQV
jgi:hypothetical protein